jgi:hypothetical protein
LISASFASAAAPLAESNVGSVDWVDDALNRLRHQGMKAIV